MYLRPYQPSDLDRIFQLDRACFAPRFRFSRATMRRVVEAQAAVVRLACDTNATGSERLLGFAAAEVQRSDGLLVGYIATLDVAPERRRAGTGRQLVAALEMLVLEAGGQWMYLHVYPENEGAVRLYEQLGYRRGERVTAFYGSGYDAWLYRKPLREGAAPDRSAAL